MLRYPALMVAAVALSPTLQAHAQTKAPQKAPSLQAVIGDPDDFTLSASVRFRYETIAGQARQGLPSDDEQLAVRSTLKAEYRTGPFRIGGELFDSRVYLDKADSAVTANEVNALELVQAYVGADLGDVLGTGSTTQIQAGRMMLNLGSRRLVAADDYRNTTNGYTGLRADWKARDGTSATLVYVLPQSRLPEDDDSIRNAKVRMDRESFDTQLWGGLISRPRTIAGAMAELGYFNLKEKDAPGRPTRNRNLHTVSARVILDPKAGKWDFEAESIYQLGSTHSGLAANAALLNVEAWFLHVDAGYTIPGPAKMRVSVEFDYASGDGSGARYGRFDSLFGMRRGDLAPSGIYNAVTRVNIITPGLRVEAAPDHRVDFLATYRPMWLANKRDAFATTGVRDPSGQSGSFAGHQIEARVRYWLVPNFLRAEVNAIWLARGEFLKTAPGARSEDTRYLSTGIIAML